MENEELATARVRLLMALMRHDRAREESSLYGRSSEAVFELYKECRRRAEELRELREKYKQP
jgi:hypothetical protein